jgi:hypothetical protein
LCTLTYDIALTVNSGGKFCAALPSLPGNPFYDVLGAAQAAAGRIGF